MSDSFIDKSGRERKRKTHCLHGHQFDGTEKWSTNWRGYKCRVCRECGRLRMQRKRENPEYRARGAAAQARWRETHPEENRIQWQRVHTYKKQILLDARAAGCMMCGEKDPSCLDFHHREGKDTKEGDIATMRRFGVKRLLAEIAKCDVLCSNCHRKHHRDKRQIKLLEGV